MSKEKVTEQPKVEDTFPVEQVAVGPTVEQELAAMKAELARVKAEAEFNRNQDEVRQKQQRTRYPFRNATAQRRWADQYANALKQTILDNCQVELKDFFNKLNPKHSAKSINKYSYGDIMDTLVKAAKQAAQRPDALYPPNLVAFADNMFRKPGSAKPPQHDPTRDHVQFDFEYPNTITEMHMVNGRMQPMGGSNTYEPQTGALICVRIYRWDVEALG